MSPKYPALPYLTFSEPHLMSENSRSRTHQRTIPHRNEQSEFFFPSVPVERFIYTNCHLIRSQTHTYKLVCVCSNPPKELPSTPRFPWERGHDPLGDCRVRHRRRSSYISRLYTLYSCKLNLARNDKQTSKSISEGPSDLVGGGVARLSAPQTWQNARPSVTCHSLVNSDSKTVSHLLRAAQTRW